jgi:hypothetical protein
MPAENVVNGYTGQMLGLFHAKPFDISLLPTMTAIQPANCKDQLRERTVDPANERWVRTP